MKTDPYYQQQRCSAIDCSFWQYIRFTRIFAEVPWRRGVKRQWGNVDFQGFQTLRLRHLRKWGQHYYTALLSPFRWPRNYVTLNDLEWPFYVKFSLLRTALFYIFTIESVYTRNQRRCADVRKWTVIQRIFGIRGKKCGSFVDAASSES